MLNLIDYYVIIILVNSMNSRMEKYEDEHMENMSRAARNKKIYSSLDFDDLSRIKTNDNVSVISDAEKEIDIEKIKNYINSMNEEKPERKKRISLEIPAEDYQEEMKEEERDYDINSVLERAKVKRETDYEIDRHRKLNSTQYDILKSIKITEESNNEPSFDNNSDQLNTQEKTIVDLIQTISINSKNIKEEKSEEKDLFQDLIGNNENTMVMAPISEDTNKETLKEELESMTQDLERIKQPINDLTQDLILEKEKLKKLSPEEINNQDIDYEDTTKSKTEEFENSQIEKSFFTNSMSFSKKDFEGFEDLENNMKKSSFFTKVAIFLIILMLLGTIFIILNYVLDLKIF